MIKVNELTVMEEDKMFRLNQSLGRVGGLIKRDEGRVCGTKVNF